MKISPWKDTILIPISRHQWQCNLVANFNSVPAGAIFVRLLFLVSPRKVLFGNRVLTHNTLVRSRTRSVKRLSIVYRLETQQIFSARQRRADFHFTMHRRGKVHCMKKGKFIVLDGNDGSGKATQSKLLAERLQREGIASARMDFPQYEQNFFGTLIGECLAGKHGDFLRMDQKIASTLYALDRFESTKKIQNAIDEGAIVIADRFSSSNQIHQGGKIADENERIQFLQWLDTMEHEILRIPRPDLILYLRVPVEVSIKLLLEKHDTKNQMLGEGVRDVVEEDRQYLERSFETANWLARREANWKVIDCMFEGNMRTVEDIHAELYAIVEGFRKE